MEPDIIVGDFLEQEVEVIVNPWNRNIIPWWLLLPQGVSGAIKKKACYEPFKELSKVGTMKLGSAHLTSAGKLPFKGIIHVAGINMFWIATKNSISESVISAMKLVAEKSIHSIAFPLIGSGSGNRGKEYSLSTMLETFGKINSHAKTVIVKYKNKK